MAAMASSTSNSLTFQPEDTDQDTNGKSPFNLNSIFGALNQIQSPSPDRQLEYLFEDEYVQTGPSWGARICYGAGITYITGLGLGGLWGLSDGLRNPIGRTSTRLRINCILNSCTARGPFLGNNMGILALLYNLIHGGVVKARDGKYDIYSSVGSATAAGLIYKSTKGLRPMGMAGGLMGSGMLVFQLCKRYYEQQSALNA